MNEEKQMEYIEKFCIAPFRGMGIFVESYWCDLHQDYHNTGYYDADFISIRKQWNWNIVYSP